MCSLGKKVAIIGAGKMGRWFTHFFVNEGCSVVVSSRSRPKLIRLHEELGVDTASTADAVRDANIVLICVPIRNFEEVVKEISAYIHSNQVVMDICSIKEFPVQIMHKYLRTGLTLGTHPLFGPGVQNIQEQNFVLTPVDEREKAYAQTFKRWLEQRNAKVSIMAPKRHDELMSVVLGFPHFLGLVISDVLLAWGEYPEAKKVAGASYRMLATFAEAIVSEEAEFYATLQMMLPDASKIENLFIEKSLQWLKLVRQKDQAAFAERMRKVKSRLKKVNSDYAESYKVIHRLLEAFKS